MSALDKVLKLRGLIPEKLCDQAAAELAQLRTENKLLKVENEQIGELSAINLSLRAELDEAKAQLTSLRTEIANLRGKVLELREKLDLVDDLGLYAEEK